MHTQQPVTNISPVHAVMNAAQGLFGRHIQQNEKTFIAVLVKHDVPIQKTSNGQNVMWSGG